MNTDILLKNTLYQHLHASLALRITNAQIGIQSAKDSKNNETKSSAGDKFETGRAMMQLEQEKNEMQLSKLRQLENVLAQIDLEKNYKKVELGSLVKTNQGTYFMSIGVGKIKLEQDTYFAISLDSPIGQLLVGKRVGEKSFFREKEICILEIS